MPLSAETPAPVEMVTRFAERNSSAARSIASAGSESMGGCIAGYLMGKMRIHRMRHGGKEWHLGRT